MVICNSESRQAENLTKVHNIMFKFNFSFYRSDDYSYMYDVLFDSVPEGIVFGYKVMQALHPSYTELEMHYEPADDSDSQIRGFFRVSRNDVMSFK